MALAAATFLAATMCTVTGAAPAHALTGLADNTAPCGAILAGARVTVTTKLINDDTGSHDVIRAGSYAKVRAYRCSDGASIKFTGTLQWQVTATGWGVVSCGTSVSGFSCDAGLTSDKWNYDYGFSSSYGATREISSYESLYFKDGAGDTTKVCSKVTAVASSTGKGVSATTCVTA